MLCPACVTSELVVIDREGVEIDYCPKCRGVWLERNELDTIIRRSRDNDSPNPVGESRYPSERDRDRDREYREHDREKHEHYHKKRKGGFLEDLFDF